MSLILNIDTAIESAYVSIAEDGNILSEMMQENIKSHAAFLQPAIQTILQKTGIDIQDLSAIAIANGPGSYTGLRVGMATAKGLCYALDIPLITIGSLHSIALQAIQKTEESQGSASALFCPMIDARRMEVYTALFTQSQELLSPPAALILDKESFAKYLITHDVYFCGNGATKWAQMCTNKNAFFLALDNNTKAMSLLSYNKFCHQSFADVAYCTPLYVKEFFTSA